jgi:hypothetical protein
MPEPEQDMKPWEDPIVAEVRSAREALLAASAYDLEELCRRLRQEQQAGGRTVVTLPPRLPEGKEAAA